jgi:DNA-binding NtrC family response regulator
MKQKHILVVDDEWIARKNLGRMLTAEGYAVTLAADGQEANTQMTAVAIDLVLTDLRMPKLDGWGVLQHVQRVAAAIPVLLLTAHATPETVRTACQLGARKVIAKPVDFADLLERIAHALTPQEGTPRSPWPRPAAGR